MKSLQRLKNNAAIEDQIPMCEKHFSLPSIKVLNDYFRLTVAYNVMKDAVRVNPNLIHVK